MKKINTVILILALTVSFTGCSSEVDEKSNEYSNESVESINSEEKSMQTFNDDGENPGGLEGNTRTLLKYNDDNFEFDHNVIRVVLDNDSKIIDPPESEWDEIDKNALQSVNELSELEYLGTGEVIGTDPNAKLYIMKNGNILAIRPCNIEPYTDAEEMLSKYSTDSIFEVNTFIKVLENADN